jgi:hypothetical protein
METWAPEQVNPETKRMMLGFQALSQKSQNEGYNVKITLPGNPSFKFVAFLPLKNMKVSKQEIAGELYILCRVKTKLRRNETFELFSIIPGLKMNREMLRDLIKQFQDMPTILGMPPKMEDLRISYPAMVVTPIAIYR